MPEMFTIQQLMGRWDVSRQTIYRWRKNGDLNDKRLGPQTVRITAEEVRRFEESRPELKETS